MPKLLPGAATMQQDDFDGRWRRAQWRCRRGMQELDVLLQRYVKKLAGDAAQARRELPLLEQILELQDPELQRYLLAGELPADPEQAALVARIREPPGAG